MYSVIDEKNMQEQELHSIQDSLEDIKRFMEKELAFKQSLIDQYKDKIDMLKLSLAEKDHKVITQQMQLDECRQTNEGKRQLINKLLGDINSYQKDIEWYKRTYVKRSLAGTIWQKLFRK